MPANIWTITNRGTGGTAATASQAAPTAAKANNTQIRLRAIQCSLVNTVAGTDRLVVRDGATGAGAIIWSRDLSVPANGSDGISESDMDLRASLGNALTVEFVSGNGTEDVNAQGDFIPSGLPYGATGGI